jgi:DNA-binding transcriptional ArsR family regulator
MGSEAAWLQGIANPVRLQIVRWLCEVDHATAAELTRGCQTDEQTLRRHLGALVDYGLIAERSGESDGETPGRPPTRFSLHPEVRSNIRSTLRQQ